MLSGLIAALVVPKVLPESGFLVSFPIIFTISALGSFLGSLLTRPDEEEVLVEFYSNVRPWGFWKPIYKKIVQSDPDFQSNSNFGRDMFNSLIGIIWQMGLTVTPIFLIIREYRNMWLALATIVITSIILKFNWLDKLEK